MVAIKTPLINGDGILEDISIFSKSKIISNELMERRFNLEKCDPAFVLGKVKKVCINKDKTIMIEGEG